MNTIRRIGFCGLASLALLGLRAQQINPMTEAVLRNYSDILAENPKDYITLFDRASQYMNLRDYDKALNDINSAIEYTPDKEKAYKIAELSLKGEIETAMGNYKGAIETIKSGLKLQPSEVELYKLGNLYLMDNEPEEALKTFQQLQRESPRSQDAFYGMAKANIILGRNDEALNLMEQIESLGQQSYLTYCRLGDLYTDLGDLRKATKNYLVAYTLTDQSSRPMESLRLLMKKNPKEVIETIDQAISSSSENFQLNYVKAILAFDNGLYNYSEQAAKDIAKNLEEGSPAVFRMMAMSQLAQNKLAEAKENILSAEKLSPKNPGVLLDKVEIMINQDPGESYSAAKEALIIKPADETVLMTAAKAAIMAGEYQDALKYLNELIFNNPSDCEALLLRGYLNSEFLKDSAAGIADYTKASNVPQDGSFDNLILSALAKYRSGNEGDAEAMIKEAIEKADKNNESLYLIAAYYAQTGNPEKAKEYADKAMLNGYNNLYKLVTDKTPVLNLGPIHTMMGGK